MPAAPYFNGTPTALLIVAAAAVGFAAVSYFLTTKSFLSDSSESSSSDESDEDSDADVSQAIDERDVVVGSSESSSPDDSNADVSQARDERDVVVESIDPAKLKLLNQQLFDACFYGELETVEGLLDPLIRQS